MVLLSKEGCALTEKAAMLLKGEGLWQMAGNGNGGNSRCKYPPQYSLVKILVIRGKEEKEGTIFLLRTEEHFLEGTADELIERVTNLVIERDELEALFPIGRIGGGNGTYSRST